MNIDENEMPSLTTFQNIQQMSKLEDYTDLLKSPLHDFFESNLAIINNYINSNEAVDENINNSLRSFKNAFKVCIGDFEESILNSNLINILIEILLKTKVKLQKNNGKNDICPNQLQLTIIQKHVLDIFIELSQASNPVIQFILQDNELFNHLISISSTIKYSEQAIAYLQVFHLFFMKFYSISYSYIIPKDTIDFILSISNKVKVLNSPSTYPYLITFLEDLLKYVELSEKDVDDLITSAFICIFDVGSFLKYRNSCNLLKLLFKKIPESVELFLTYEYFPKYFFPKHFSESINSFLKAKNYGVVCEICSLIDETLDCVKDMELKVDVIDFFPINQLYSILQKNDAKNKNVSYVFNLIAKHLEYKSMTLNDFIENGGYKLLVDFLTETSFPVVVSIMKLLCKMAELFGWPMMPENSFSLFLDRCFEILTPEDNEVIKIFYDGFYSALSVADTDFRQKVIDIYNGIEGMSDLLEKIENNSSKDSSYYISQIMAIINNESI